MKTRYKNTPRLQAKISKLPKVYLVACWARYGVMEFPYAGKMVKSYRNNTLVPLVYEHYDGNGACDDYIVTEIFNTTSASCFLWTFDQYAAEKVKMLLNDYYHMNV